MSASFVTSDGHTLAYRRIGDGPLLVCHCGGPGFPGATLGDLGGLTDDREAPTLVVTGDHDFFGPLAADEIVAGIPDARCVVLGEAGHFAWFDAPDEFRKEVSRFLAQ